MSCTGFLFRRKSHAGSLLCRFSVIWDPLLCILEGLVGSFIAPPSEFGTAALFLFLCRVTFCPLSACLHRATSCVSVVGIRRLRLAAVGPAVGLAVGLGPAVGPAVAMALQQALQLIMHLALQLALQ